MRQTLHEDNLKITIIALDSYTYPSSGESHGASVVAGAIIKEFPRLGPEQILVLDMACPVFRNIDTVLQKVVDFNPNVLAFSISYGTYDIIKELFERLQVLLPMQSKLIVFGGVLATYIPEELLLGIYDKAIVVIGEGDETAPMLLRELLTVKTFNSIPNLCFIQDGEFIYTQRKLVPLDKFAIPYRSHLGPHIKNKLQIYAESSRGCSWAACTFCLRGLTDVKGRSIEYRRIPNKILRANLANLYRQGIRAITFADEDFLGAHSQANEKFVSGLEQIMAEEEITFLFDVSLTVHSIFSHRMSSDEKEKTVLLLKRLKLIGLRKVFLGIESGSSGQLKRFAKGHTAEEAIEAINIILSLGIQLEIGFIMLDPLCTLNEISENINFIFENDLAPHISFVANELRLQFKSNYLRILENYEIKNKKKLYDRNLDLNTISYNYVYAEEAVNTIVNIIREWNSKIRIVHYPLKNMSRYGDGGSLGQHRPDIIKVITLIRRGYLGFIRRLVDQFKLGDQSDKTNEDFNYFLADICTQVLKFRQIDGLQFEENSNFSSLLADCEKLQKTLLPQ